MFKITFGSEAAAQEYARRVPDSAVEGAVVSLQAPASGTDGVIKAAKGLEVVSVDETHEDLEEYFMNIYRKEIR